MASRSRRSRQWHPGPGGAGNGIQVQESKLSMFQHQCYNFDTFWLKNHFLTKTPKNPKNSQPPKIPGPAKNFCERSEQNLTKIPNYNFSTEHPIFSMHKIISSLFKLSGILTKIFVGIRYFSLMHILTWSIKLQVISSSIEIMSFILRIP
jgi:hypothetical protein